MRVKSSVLVGCCVGVGVGVEEKRKRKRKRRQRRKIFKREGGAFFALAPGVELGQTRASFTDSSPSPPEMCPVMGMYVTH